MDQKEKQDLVIVGAGPHALSMALRWVQGPIGNFSEDEHRILSYYQNKEGNKVTLHKKVTVIDPSGEWLAKWNLMFDALQIPFLRSTMFMHPVPPGEIKRKKRAKQQFKGLTSFPENRRELFFRPSQQLFKDYCQHLIKSYQLEDRVVKATVKSLEPMKNGNTCVLLDSGGKIEAKFVVLATGFSLPQIPPWFPPLKATHPQHVMHSGEWCFKKPHLDENTTSKRVLIVGGGLTSAHLAVASVKQGCKVVLISRKQIISKLFDLDLNWMGSSRNIFYAKFWKTTDLNERLKIISEARGGGSITPDIRRLLQQLQETQDLQIFEECEIANVTDGEVGIDVEFTNGCRQSFDYVWASTGSKVSIVDEPYLQAYFKSNTANIIRGFPVLDQHLRLNSNHNIFIMGPDARNLSGCRNAADRICSYIEDLPSSNIKHNSKAATWGSDYANDSYNSYEVSAYAQIFLKYLLIDKDTGSG